MRSEEDRLRECCEAQGRLLAAREETARALGRELEVLRRLDGLLRAENEHLWARNGRLRAALRRITEQEPVAARMAHDALKGS